MSRSIRNRAALVAVAVVSFTAASMFDSIHADSGDRVGDETAGASRMSVDAAAFTASGELVRPANLDRWMFLGASLGMGYNNVKVDANNPGKFQVVLMEPAAYEYFKTHGKYADGSMLLLSFYATDQRVSISQAGFVQGDLENFEIHLIDRARFAEGRAFYPFAKDADKATALPAGNPCVECHVKDGAFDGTFVQFYPAIRHLIPADLLRKSMSKGRER